LIDTHCHLLWRLDDGPASPIASVELARVLVEQGVETVLCTPHYSSRFPTQPRSTHARFADLRRSLGEVGVPLRVELAAEIASKLALSVPIEELTARAIGSFVIVELEVRASPDASVLVVERLRGAGLTPIFAHPERCRAVRADPRPLDEARRGGALVQVMASSLVGRWGGDVAQAGWSLLESGKADLLASDAHTAGGSVRRLRETVDRVGVRYGREAAEALTLRMPAKVLSLEPAGSY
jgi:protein-tyrosine phosphatase